MNILEGASLTSTTPKRRDAGPDVSSRLLRHSRDICLFTVKNLSLDYYFLLLLIYRYLMNIEKRD